MTRLTCFIAWLLGYYWEPCSVCGRGLFITGSGRIYSVWCSLKRHRQEDSQ